MGKTKSKIFITLITCSLLSCTRNPSVIPSDNQGPFENEHIHSFQSNYCADDTNHWKECSCGEKSEISSHVYINGICEVCGYKKPSEGLKFVDLGDYCGVDDLGTCTDQIIVIPANYNGKPVETIQEKAFINCYNLTNVIFPNTIHYIADNAFENCEKLDNIVVSENVGSIGGSAFSGCIGLTNIELPTNLENIGGFAFYGCSELRNITIPNKITSISWNLFGGCTELTNVVLPVNLSEIQGYAFLGCSSLDNITFPDNIKKIGESAFDGCTNLKSLIIPNSVKEIGDSAFTNCSGLGSIIVDSRNRVYDSRNNCNAIIESKTNELIFGCSTTVIPNTVTSIRRNAFRECSNLKTMTIPNGITKISSDTFRECNKLEEVTIPNTIQEIGSGAFQGCSSLERIHFDGSLREWQNVKKSTFWKTNVPNSCRIICNDAVVSE